MMSIHDADGEGTPLCWNWDLSHMLKYADDRFRHFLGQQGQAARFGVTIDEVRQVRDLIIHCLRNQVVFAHDAKKKDGITLNMCVRVHLYGCARYPITDIYTAFGWFITITDVRPSIQTDSILFEQYKTVLLYARLLKNLSSRLPQSNVCPKMTHMFLSLDYHTVLGVGPIDLASSGSTTVTKYSMSSSLPYNDQDSDQGTFKAAAVQKRVDALKTAFPYLRIKEFSSHQNPIGSCAETLNALIVASSSSWLAPNPIMDGSRNKHVYMFGAAVRTAKMSDQFKGFEAYLGDDVAVPPCETCCHLFKVLGIKYFDITRLRVHGALPKNYKVDKYWGIWVVCECCHGSYPWKTCHKCPTCDVAWCNMESDYPDSECQKQGQDYKHICPKPGFPEGTTLAGGAGTNQPEFQVHSSHSTCTGSNAPYNSSRTTPSVDSVTSGPSSSLISQFSSMQIQSSGQRHGASQAYQYGQPSMQSHSMWMPSAGATSTQTPGASNPGTVGPQTRQIADSHPRTQTWGPAHQVQAVANAYDPRDYFGGDPNTGLPHFPPQPIRQQNVSSQTTSSAPFQSEFPTGTLSRAKFSGEDSNEGVPIFPTNNTRSIHPSQSMQSASSSQFQSWPAGPRVNAVSGSSTSYNAMTTQTRGMVDPQTTLGTLPHPLDAPLAFPSGFHQGNLDQAMGYENLGQPSETYRRPPPPMPHISSTSHGIPYTTVVPSNAYPATQGMPGPMQPQSSGSTPRRGAYASVVASSRPVPGPSMTRNSDAMAAGPSITLSAVPGEPNEEFYGVPVHGYPKPHANWHALNEDQGSFAFVQKQSNKKR